MELFQWSNPRVIIRGDFDNVDFWNIVDNIFKVKGYQPIQSYNSPIFELAGCEFRAKSGHHFTFEYDDWGNLELCPEDPANEELLDELHLLADEIELMGSTNPSYSDSHVSRRNYPKRPRIFEVKK
jgi:hypothetical protein